MTRISVRPVLCWLAVLVLAAAPARAMQFETVPSKGGTLFMFMRGEIHDGDLRLFRRALANVPAGQHVSALFVDSPGGNLLEGERLAALIHDGSLPVIVASDSKCASACFLLLAASPRRVAGTSALVGVHSANIDGHETTDSMAMTLQMQRVAGAYGVPPAIIGKMAQATPGRMEWLTHADLAAMDVRIVDDSDDDDKADVPTPARRPVASPALPIPQPPAPIVGSPSAVVGQAEFQGALFCSQGTAALVLRVVDSSDRADWKAVFDFAPMATSRQFPSGSFIVEGRLDLSGGGIDLRPTRWVSSQPTNFAMVGLAGRSDDGGKTFSGRATVSPTCTVFTLKRIH